MLIKYPGKYVHISNIFFHNLRTLQQHENDKQLKQINAGPRIFV
jgi:hypothetical protein